MTYQSNKNRPRKRRNDRNQNWVMWLVGPTVAIVLLFVCGVASLILWRVADRVESLGANPQTIFEAPTRAPGLVIPTPLSTVPLPTLDGGAGVQTQPEPTAVEPTPEPVASAEISAPTATLAQEPPPTAIPVPVATATIPPNGSVTAFRSAESFNIDADLTDWTNYTSYNATFRVYTSNTWDGTDDSEGFWRLSWDDSNLYLGVFVTDELHVQTQTGNQIFRGDSIEMQIDTDRDGDYGNGLNNDDYQIVLSPGDFSSIGASAFRFHASNSGQMLDQPGHSIQLASKKIEDGYILEAAIPWFDLGVQPQSGKVFGVSLNVNDNDAPGTAQQQMLKSHVSTRQYSNPSTWGLLILSDR